MRTYKVTQIDSFSDTLFGGNPAAIVFDAETLTDEEMKKIAREMNLPETGFILPSTEADYRLRFFTRSGVEVPFCGHATIASLRALDKSRKYKIEIEQGILDAEQNGSTFILESPAISMEPAPYTHRQLAEAMGIPISQLEISQPIIKDMVNNYLFLFSPDLDTLGRMRPNFGKIAKFCNQEKVQLINVMTTETIDPDNDVHSRSFAPACGIDEDPMTGSAQGGIITYLKSNALIKEEKIGSEQGHFIHRPSFVHVELTPENRARLYAKAVSVFATEIKLP